MECCTVKHTEYLLRSVLNGGTGRTLMNAIRYVYPKQQYWIPPEELQGAIEEYHRALLALKEAHNLQFSPLYKPFTWENKIKRSSKDED